MVPFFKMQIDWLTCHVCAVHATSGILCNHNYGQTNICPHLTLCRWRTPIRVVEKSGGVALWRSPHKSQGSSVQRLLLAHSSHQDTPTPQRQTPATSSLIYSSSPSSSQRVVKQTPRKLFPTFPLDLDKS